MVKISVIFSLFCSFLLIKTKLIKLNPRNRISTYIGLENYLKSESITKIANHPGFYRRIGEDKIETLTGRVDGTKYKRVIVYSNEEYVQAGRPKESYSYKEDRPLHVMVLEKIPSWKD